MRVLTVGVGTLTGRDATAIFLTLLPPPRPREEEERKQPSTEPGAGSHQTADKLTPWPWASPPPHRQVNGCCLRHPVRGIFVRAAELT